jgi:aminomethyltransferase
LRGVSAWIARTGYTGEDGFEIFCSPDDAPALWDALIAPRRIRWRQTRRAGRARHASPGSAPEPLRQRPFRHHVAARSRAWLGGEIRRRRFHRQGKRFCSSGTAGLAPQLVGFEMRERGIARHGYAISDVGTGARLGEVTSGTVGPTVGKNIGMGYVPQSHAQPGTRIVIDCRGKPAQAEIVKGTVLSPQARRKSR